MNKKHRGGHLENKIGLDTFLSKNHLQAIPQDGKIHRFDRGYHSGNAWGICSSFTIGSRTIYSYLYGDWSTGQKWNYVSETDITEEEAALLADMQRVEAERDKEKQKEAQEATSKEAREEWSDYNTVGDCRYLRDKKLDGLFGMRLGFKFLMVDKDEKAYLKEEDDPWLVVPVCNLDGDIVGYQRIGPTGTKLFKSGTPLFGSATLLPFGSRADTKQMFVCEGVATALSVHLAIGKPVYAAFNASNMKEVCASLRIRYPDADIIVCADDDDRKGPGEPNAGMAAAKHCAQVYKAKLVSPKWKGERGKGTDFNDLHFAEGIEAVRLCIQTALSIGTQLAPLVPLKGRKTPTDREVGINFMAYMESQGKRDDFVQDQGEIFTWKGTHWQMLDDRDRSVLRDRLQTLYGGTATIDRLHAIEEMLVELLRMQEAPGFFSKTPTKCNFTNGTLEFKGNEYELRPHDRKDFLTHCLPFEIDVTAKYEPGEFTKWVSSLFGDCVEDNVNLVKEIFAAAMFPKYPKAFLIYGPGGTGKTTLTRIMENLIPEKFTAKVDPKDFSGYQLADMVGKIVNICNDISSGTLPDDTVKKLLDGEPVQVRRIYKNPITAVLPKVHVFTANDLPITYETSGAYARRWVLLKTPNRIRQEDMVFGFAEQMWERNQKEILLFAMEGMKRLASNGGKYTIPKSSSDTMGEWTHAADPISNFIDAIKNGEVTGLCSDRSSEKVIGVGDGLQIRRYALYQAFADFSKGRTIPSRNRFYHKMRDHYDMLNVHHTQIFKGIGFQVKKEELC